jgi:HPt (histidine-containing phosphotransfer) domain-containing protein
VPIHLSALAAAIAAADSELVWQIAHRLHGSTLEMGVVRMAPLCAEIERAARDGSLGHAADQAEQLNREFAAARAAIELEIQKSSETTPRVAAVDAGARRAAVSVAGRRCEP